MYTLHTILKKKESMSIYTNAREEEEEEKKERRTIFSFCWFFFSFIHHHNYSNKLKNKIFISKNKRKGRKILL